MDQYNKYINKPNLITKSLYPENKETPIHFLRKWVIPEKYFYRRNHFPYPLIPQDAFYLTINGHVRNPLKFHYDDILAMPSKKLLVTLECSGNRRSKFKPKVYGEQWEDGAVSQGWWKGVPLSYLLNIVEPLPSAIEVVFEGYDFGKKPDIDGIHPFARSLPINEIFNQDVLLAYEYNDAPIPYHHGFPFRLVVPNWYAMASVKWLNRITVIDRKFMGPFQTVDYVYYPKKDSNEGFPVTKINVVSTIQKPLNYSIIEFKEHMIEGLAWSGTGKIIKVEVSLDNGLSWHDADLHQNTERYSWTMWTYKWKPNNEGEYTILSRATDSSNNTQPEEPMWNKKGYGYNGVSKIHVKLA